MELGVVVFLLLVLGLVSSSSSSSSSGGRVLRRENARGVHPQLQALLDEWELVGTHVITIGTDGGLRTDAAKQAGYAAAGNSNATTLEATPHGRGAALDVYPVAFLPFISGRWEDVPANIKQQFTDFGVFAEIHGFTWGGRWRGATFPNGDQGHVEMKNWRTLPFPPPAGGYS